MSYTKPLIPIIYVSKCKSEVWKYFRRQDQNESECLLCNSLIKSNGNTTNLHSHLQRHHPIIKLEAVKGAKKRKASSDEPHKHEESPSKKSKNGGEEAEISKMSTPPSTSTTMTTPKRSKFQLRVDSLFENQRSYADDGVKAAKATKRLVFMIAKDKMPLSTVENEGFRTFVNYTAPFYKFPSRKQLTEKMEDKYRALSNNVKDFFQELNDVVLTTDIWTDTMNNRNYLGLTSHFIRDEKLKSIMIGVIDLDDRHTADNIKKWLDEMLSLWKIRKESVVVVVADNAANIKKAVIDGFGEQRYLPCFAHTLNLVPAKILDKDSIIAPIITKVKSIVKYFKQSVTASDELRKLTDHRLIQSIKTRWGSLYDMLDKYLSLSEHTASILIKLAGDNVPVPLMGGELTTAKEIMKMLKPFKEATEIFSGEKYVTGSEALPLIKNLKHAIDYLDATTEISKHFKKSLVEEFNHRFKNIEYVNIIATATMLDPRYKKLYFSDKIATSRIINGITRELNEEMCEPEDISRSNSDESNENVSPNKETTSEGEHQTKMSSFDDELRGMLKQQAKQISSQPRSEMPEEFRYYLSQPLIDRTKDPIKYWLMMPHSALSKLALRYLTVIATSVPSERLFSQALLILTDKRSKLTPEHFQQLLFLATLPVEFWCL